MRYAVMPALLIAAFPLAAAQMDLEVTVLGDSVLAKFTNLSNSTASDIVVWTDPGDAIVSHTVESGWSASAADGAVRVLEGLEPGQSLRLGLKIGNAEGWVAWQAVIDGEPVRGWLLEAAPQQEDGAEDAGGAEAEVPEPGVLDASAFRVIPAKPSAGNPVRVVGEGFGANRQLDIEVGGRALEPVTTDGAGSFVATRTIPDRLADRIGIALIDSDGNEVSISIRLLDPVPDRTQAAELSIDRGGAESYFRGSTIRVAGTAAPLSVVSVTAFDSRDAQITSRPAVVGHDGRWSHAVLVPPDVPLGEYRVSVFDGQNTVQRIWTLTSSQTITIEPTRDQFNRGSPMRFNGTAEPNREIEMALLGPNGNEVAYTVFDVDPSGAVYWEYPTDAGFQRGTYTLIATQNGNQEFAYAGLDNPPVIPVIAIFDKPNYMFSETPRLTVVGEPNSDISLLVVNPTDSILVEDIVTTRPSGLGHYEINLANFSTGIHTAVLKKGTAQTEYKFGVGLSTATSALSASIQERHAPGGLVLVVGSTSPNSIITLSLIDPQGNEVQRTVAFSDRNGLVSDNRLRIPMDAQTGTWNVKMASGPREAVSDIIVSIDARKELAVSVAETKDGLSIVVTGATSRYVIVTVTDGENPVDTPIRSYVTQDGSGQLPWHIDVAGTYTITVADGKNTVQTTYRYNPQ